MKRTAIVLGMAVALMVGRVATAEQGDGVKARKKGENAHANRELAPAEIQARKADREKKIEEQKEKRAERKEARETLQEKVADRVDQRQENQEKRIQHGINKGYLTEDEVAKLQTQQKNLADLETSAFADGTLTRDECKGLREAVNEASRCIWAEKHDTDGNQMATYRLGANVFAKSELTAQLANEDLSSDQAKALMKDFRTLTELKQKLSKSDLSDTERAGLQQQYDELLNKYFEVR